MSVEARFKKTVELVKSLPKDGPVKPSQDDQLLFYGLYKQATEGDVTTTRPGMMDFTGKYKWDAWKKQEGVSKEEAMKLYVDHFLKLSAGEDELIAQIDAAGA